MVVITRLFEDLSLEPEKDEKKKVAASRPFSLHSSAIEPAIAVFPVPAGPDIHSTFFGRSSCSPSTIQLMISC